MKSIKSRRYIFYLIKKGKLVIVFYLCITAITIPIIKLDGTQYRVPKGQKVTLKCQVSSWMNTATVTWIRLYKELEIKLTSGKSLKYSGGTSANHSLTIYNVDEEDSGLYWCEAINSSGLSRSADVQLDIFDGNVTYLMVML